MALIIRFELNHPMSIESMCCCGICLPMFLFARMTILKHDPFGKFTHKSFLSAIVSDLR